MSQDIPEHNFRTHWTPPTITLRLEPQNTEEQIPRPKTVLQLYNRLGIRQGTVLVIRDGALLTPDRRIYADEHITLRRVVSSG